MAKFDILRKLDRNKQLIELRIAHRDKSLAEIGRMVTPPISPNRVWQILKAAGVKTVYE